MHPASLLHMMWNCPKLVRYWKDVTSLISSVFAVTMDVTPLTCLLGYVENIAVDLDEKVAFARILYMAGKVLAYHWLDEGPP